MKRSLLAAAFVMAAVSPALAQTSAPSTTPQVGSIANGGMSPPAILDATGRTLDRDPSTINPQYSRSVRPGPGADAMQGSLMSPETATSATAAPSSYPVCRTRTQDRCRVPTSWY